MEAQARLGHALLSTTTDIYHHTLTHTGINIADVLNQHLLGLLTVAPATDEAAMSTSPKRAE